MVVKVAADCWFKSTTASISLYVGLQTVGFSGLILSVVYLIGIFK